MVILKRKRQEHRDLLVFPVKKQTLKNVQCFKISVCGIFIVIKLISMF